MLKRNLQISTSILFIVIMFFITSAKVEAAGLISDVRGDSGPKPPPPTPADATPGTEPSTTPANPREKTVTITYYTAIEGYVYEDVGESFYAYTEPADSKIRGIPVKNIKVQFGSNTVRTDADGKYRFSPSAGRYPLTFTYGDTEGLTGKEDIETALKYNGHDYVAEQSPGAAGTKVNVTQKMIKQSGKGCSQVYLLIDCSASMRNNTVNVDGQTKTRLQVLVDSAKELVDSLIDSGENVYIGIVAYSGTAYRARGLTQDKSLLKKDLDYIITSDWDTGNTNMIAAIDKAEESFLNKTQDSNRTMILLSDGIPTSDGTHATYADDTEQEIRTKLQAVKTNTINKIKQVKDGGTKVYALISKSNDEVNEWAKDIFNGNASQFKQVDNGNAYIYEITDEIRKYIIEHTEAQTFSEKSQVIQGVERESRRQEVDNYFADGTFFYNSTANKSIRTALFQQIENYNNASDASTLSNITKMYVDGGTYTIEAIKHELGTFTEEEWKDDNADGIKQENEIYKTTYIYQEGTIDAGALVLKQRPALNLVTQTTVTGLKTVLADTQVYDQQQREPGSTLLMNQAITDELAFGATAFVEYAITVKNQSAVQCNHLDLIAHLPPAFIYYPNTRLLNKHGTNIEQGWKLVSKEELYQQGFITETTKTENQNRDAIRIALDNNGQGEKGFYIPSGGEYTVRVVVSMVMSSLDNFQGDNHLYAEVLGYQDAANRRMAYPSEELLTYKDKDNNEYTYSKLIGVYPGNNKEQDYAGIDSATNYFVIAPPTGLIIKRIFMGIFVTMGIVVIIYATTKIIKKKRSKKREEQKE